MKIKEKKVKQYIFNKKEVLIIFDCLLYCRHRLESHENSGINYHINGKIKDDFYNLLEKLIYERKETKNL